MRWWVSIRFDNTIWLATVCVLSSSSTRISKTPTVNNQRSYYYLFISHYLAASIEENFRSRNMFSCLFDVLNMNPSFYCLKKDFFLFWNWFDKNVQNVLLTKTNFGIFTFTCVALVALLRGGTFHVSVILLFQVRATVGVRVWREI